MVEYRKNMDRKEQEKHLVGKMIDLYALHHRGDKDNSFDTAVLKAYAFSRVDHCRFGNEKPSCKNCPVHCYNAERKLQIRQVMRWAGPRIFFYHPISTLKHLMGI